VVIDDAMSSGSSSICVIDFAGVPPKIHVQKG
jgi:hypothetical protein